MDFDSILSNLIIGSYPQTFDDVEKLRHEQAITAVLTLQTDEDMERLEIDWRQLCSYYETAGIRVFRVPVKDFDREDLERRLAECVQVLERLLQQGHSVYLHCTAGMGRAPSVAIAYLYWIQAWDLQQAIDHVNACRTCFPNCDAIQAVTSEWQLLRSCDDAPESAPPAE